MVLGVVVAMVIKVLAKPERPYIPTTHQWNNTSCPRATRWLHFLLVTLALTVGFAFILVTILFRVMSVFGYWVASTSKLCK
jgi:hypothetical protein